MPTRKKDIEDMLDDAASGDPLKGRDPFGRPVKPNPTPTPKPTKDEEYENEFRRIMGLGSKRGC